MARSGKNSSNHCATPLSAKLLNRQRIVLSTMEPDIFRCTYKEESWIRKLYDYSAFDNSSERHFTVLPVMENMEISKHCLLPLVTSMQNVPLSACRSPLCIALANRQIAI